MTITISPAVELSLKDRAERLQLPIDDVVQHALNWYIATDPDLLEEFTAIEAAHAEALWLIEDAAP